VEEATSQRATRVSMRTITMRDQEHPFGAPATKLHMRTAYQSPKTCCIKVRLKLTDESQDVRETTAQATYTMRWPLELP
jgi:hypothetical protein